MKTLFLTLFIALTSSPLFAETLFWGNDIENVVATADIPDPVEILTIAKAAEPTHCYWPDGRCPTIQQVAMAPIGWGTTTSSQSTGSRACPSGACPSSYQAASSGACPSAYRASRSGPVRQVIQSRPARRVLQRKPARRFLGRVFQRRGLSGRRCR